MLYDVIIVGGGPAGVAAAVYAARKKLAVLLLTESFGGQSIVSKDIQNWIGDVHVSGTDLAKRLEDHVRAYPDDVTIMSGARVKMVETVRCAEPQRVCDFRVTAEDGRSFDGKTVIVASGARRRHLGIPGEDTFDGKGVAYCATCDAPLFAGKNVVVVGGGNAGLEAALDLRAYANKVFVFERGEVLKGDAQTQEKVRADENIDIRLQVEPIEVLGDAFVKALRYKDLSTGEGQVLDVEGVFVEIGSVPNSEMVKELVDLDRFGQIVTDAKHATTRRPGLFAAGDVTDDPYKQNNISVGDGVRAALAAYAYLQNREKQSPADA